METRWAIARYDKKLGHWVRMTTSRKRRWFSTQQKLWVQAKLKAQGIPMIATKIKERPVLQHWPYLSGDTDCNDDLLRRLNKVGKDVQATVFVASGFRSRAEQEKLYAMYLKGIGNLAAVPGTSPHESGRAADCSIGGVNIGSYPGARASMKNHGLVLPVPGEPWHVEVKVPGREWRA